jgi:hypothetical protein
MQFNLKFNFIIIFFTKILNRQKPHLTISDKWAGIIQCYGLTRDPRNRDYMLVM